jgi:hypothetical protein
MDQSAMYPFPNPAYYPTQARTDHPANDPKKKRKRRKNGKLLNKTSEKNDTGKPGKTPSQSNVMGMTSHWWDEYK